VPGRSPCAPLLLAQDVALPLFPPAATSSGLTYRRRRQNASAPHLRTRQSNSARTSAFASPRHTRPLCLREGRDLPVSGPRLPLPSAPSCRAAAPPHTRACAFQHREPRAQARADRLATRRRSLQRSSASLAPRHIRSSAASPASAHARLHVIVLHGYPSWRTDPARTARVPLTPAPTLRPWPARAALQCCPCHAGSRVPTVPLRSRAPPVPSTRASSRRQRLPASAPPPGATPARAHLLHEPPTHAAACAAISRSPTLLPGAARAPRSRARAEPPPGPACTAPEPPRRLAPRACVRAAAARRSGPPAPLLPHTCAAPAARQRPLAAQAARSCPSRAARHLLLARAGWRRERGGVEVRMEPEKEMLPMWRKGRAPGERESREGEMEFSQGPKRKIRKLQGPFCKA
jgi:hypothetical protein